MYDFKLNKPKNAILCVLKGRFEEAEARAYVAKYKQGIDQLKPGFSVIADVSKFVPTTDEIRDVLLEGTAYAVRKGMARAVRIVDESALSQVSNAQLDRTARGLGYQADVVSSMAEATALLGLD